MAKFGWGCVPWCSGPPGLWLLWCGSASAPVGAGGGQVVFGVQRCWSAVSLERSSRRLWRPWAVGFLIGGALLVGGPLRWCGLGIRSSGSFAGLGCKPGLCGGHPGESETPWKSQLDAVRWCAWPGRPVFGLAAVQGSSAGGAPGFLHLSGVMALPPPSGVRLGRGMDSHRSHVRASAALGRRVPVSVVACSAHRAWVPRRVLPAFLVRWAVRVQLGVGASGVVQHRSLLGSGRERRSALVVLFNARLRNGAKPGGRRSRLHLAHARS